MEEEGCDEEVKKPEVSSDNMCKKPCRDCPFRRKSLPGWLGAASPEHFMLTTFGEKAVEVDGGKLTMMMPAGPEQPMPCHLTIDYNDPYWSEKWNENWESGEETGSLCAGAAVMFANRAKKPKYINLPKREPDRENVFTTPQEFIDHHRSSGFRSWQKDDDLG